MMLLMCCMQACMHTLYWAHLLLVLSQALDVCPLPGQSVPHGHSICAQAASILQSTAGREHCLGHIACLGHKKVHSLGKLHR